jgi:hypothetical protein
LQPLRSPSSGERGLKRKNLIIFHESGNVKNVPYSCLQVLENALRGREDYLEEFDTYLTEASNHPEIIRLA